MLPAAGLAIGPDLTNQGLSPFDLRQAHQPGQLTRAQRALDRSLGSQGVVQVNPETGTPRAVLKLDGFLTGASNAGAQQIALDYVDAHLGAFGIQRADLARLRLVRNYTDVGGTHHLGWAQTYRGIPAFDNELRVNVTSDGRLINVFGSLVPDLSVASTLPRLTAAEAVAAALRDAGGAIVPLQVSERRDNTVRHTRFVGGNTAELVLFGDARGARLAWQVRAQASSIADYIYVIDATNGSVLWRANMVAFAGGQVFEYYPSEFPGLPFEAGHQRFVTFPADWATSPTMLQGEYVHAYADPMDDNAPSAGDEIPPNSGNNWNYLFQDFQSQGWNCDPYWKCSWSQFDSTSWLTNVKQNATQVYYYNAKYHDHLAAAPIGFTEAAGNFEQTNTSGGIGGDPVQAQVDDGAQILDGSHRNNANMNTQQDGVPPRMQMYLFNDLNTASPDGNGGDDASVMYHEYTHGLSNRLVSTGANNIPALNSFQSRSMGEGWSDWYALDFLVKQGYDFDTTSAGDVNVGFFLRGGQTTGALRSEPMDCPADRDSHGGACPGGQTGHAGGYTFGDMGHVINGPEFHADGEIWAQTIWSLRQQLIAALGTTNGTARAESVITRAMELSPPNPSFLDMRNAIIQAENVNYGGAQRAVIWGVFASRGMGYFASTLGGNDVTPVENFSQPPAPGSPTGTLTGVVTRLGSSTAVAGARVSFGGHNSGYPDDLVATTNASGQYGIGNIPVGTYPHLLVTGPGYDPLVLANQVINVGTNTRSIQLERNWAALSGGSAVYSFTLPDYTPQGCGPAGALDQSLTSGWCSDAPGPRAVVVRLPERITLSGFQVDPGATGGDPDSASTAQYRIETAQLSGSGPGAFTQAAAGTFSAPNNHRLNSIAATAGTANVSFVRFTMVTNQGNPLYMDMSELVVRGSAAPPPPPPGQPPPPPQTRRCRVPRVIGQRLKVARTRIRRANCRVGRVRRARSRKRAGRVIRQSPRPGVRLRNGARVNLVVSRGRGPQRNG
jgi:hypothetical protein